ncbi:DUF4214 domain-containing protein [Microvirga rosea]|uniref:DUF4214 domain-containing protein n=1 Tax=Microvirga rosea TaxID=2715425 RepID=UPI001D0B76C0|nr:DUF4214 domain-containing protein [Microvirga rosea]MCB8822880.1 FG-GAP-like repeat-containing protein [Microvirga rosea]
MMVGTGLLTASFEMGGYLAPGSTTAVVGAVGQVGTALGRTAVGFGAITTGVTMGIAGYQQTGSLPAAASYGAVAGVRSAAIGVATLEAFNVGLAFGTAVFSLAGPLAPVAGTAIGFGLGVGTYYGLDTYVPQASLSYGTFTPASPLSYNDARHGLTDNDVLEAGSVHEAVLANQHDFASAANNAAARGAVVGGFNLNGPAMPSLPADAVSWSLDNSPVFTNDQLALARAEGLKLDGPERVAPSLPAEAQDIAPPSVPSGYSYDPGGYSFSPSGYSPSSGGYGFSSGAWGGDSYARDPDSGYLGPGTGYDSPRDRGNLGEPGDSYGDRAPSSDGGYSKGGDFGQGRDYSGGARDYGGYDGTTRGSFNGFGPELGGAYGNNYGYSSYDGQSYSAENTGDNSPGEGARNWPIILDLTGDGIQITQKSSSSTFFDMAGDGYKHRTAWAGAGNGVLAIDADGDGQITNRSEAIFTDWDPTASGDMQALRNVFDTNQNGRLDAGDARWSQFRVMVTNSDGTTSVKTLAELGIESINLIADKTNITLPDGSKILGQATYTRTDGTTGTAADAALSYDLEGYVVQKTVTQNADGSTSIVNKMLNADGTLASAITGLTSADGKTVTLLFDRNGDTVVDDMQSRATVTHADGSKTETLANSTAAGRLTDRTVTETSADKAIVSISRDSNGDTFADQTEFRATQANGTSTIVVSDLSRDGTLIRQATSTVAADGLTRTTDVDVDGNGIADDKEQDATLVNSDDSRVQTISIRNANDTLRNRTIKTISSDGRTQTIQQDLDGDGANDLVQSIVITVTTDGSSTSSNLVQSRDGSLQTSTTATVSADGLVRQTWSDVDGDGDIDLSTSDATVIHADGSRTQTVETHNGDGSLHIKEIVFKGSDGRSRTTQTDSNGDGAFDRVETIAVDTTGASVATVSAYNEDGSLRSKLVSTTSATGLARTDQSDENGDGIFDRTVANVTVLNADGSSTTTQTTTNTDGAVRGKVVTTASANGLSQTTQVDANGDSVFDLSTADVTVLNADGSKVRTLTATNANGSLRSRETTQTSSDRQTTTFSRDTNGDGSADESISSAVQANGSVVETATHLTAGGSLIDKVVATKSANGLSSTIQRDLNGDGIYDLTTAVATVLHADGSRITTATDTHADGSLRGKTVTTVSATGLSRTSQTDANGDGTFDLTTTEVTVLNANGSRTTTRTAVNPDGTVRDKTIGTVSANGFVTTVERDVNGDSITDIITTDVMVLNANGSQVHTITEANADGSLRQRSEVTVSDDKRSSASQIDTDGDGHADKTVVVATLVNGDTVTTIANLDSAGHLTSRTVTTASATGLSQTAQVDVNGDGVVDVTATDVTTLSADGGRTTTHRTLNSDGSLRDQTVASVSATGLVKTTKVDADADGTFETTTTDTTLLNIDGSRTQTVTVTNANGSLRRKDIVTTSDDGETVSVSRDLNGDGKIDRTVTTAIDGNKNLVETRANLSATGTLINKIVETTSATGLDWTQQRDLNGDGAFDRVQARHTVLNVDGSRTTTLTDTAYSGSGGAVAKLKSSVVSTVSGNGLSASYTFDAAGPGYSPNLFKRSATDVTTLNADGSRTETISTFSGSAVLLDRSTTIISGNGLSKTTQLDVDGNGSIERASSKTIAVNGAVTETAELKSLTGSLIQKSVVTTSADGLRVVGQVDTNGDSLFDRLHTTIVNADRSVTDSWENTGTAEASRDKVVTVTSADGLAKTVQVDGDGDGLNDRVTTSIVALNADGSQTTVVSETNDAGQLVSKTTTTTSDDGLTVTSIFDTNGDGTTDRTTTTNKVLNIDGSTTTTVASRYADNSLHKKIITTTTADGRTTTSKIDSDGDGIDDKVVTTTVNADETQSETTQYYSATGALTSSVTRTVSADGQSVARQWSNGVVEKTEYLANQNGSYTWTQATGGFDNAKAAYSGYGSASGGWSSQEIYPREMADVNGDGRADIVGFAHNAINVALGQADGSFAAAIVAGNGFTYGSSWNSDNTYPRKLADVNGDGRADIIGFGSGAVYVALGQSNGTFGTSFIAYNHYGAGNGWSTQDAYPREIADVNGDGRADIVGFASGGVSVSLGQADGTFGTAFVGIYGYGTAGGWTSDNTMPRKLADVNGDGRADIVGFASNGVYVSLGQANGKFGTASLAYSGYGTAGGWTSQDATPRELADINGDGRADIVGFATDGVYVSFGQANGTFSSAVFSSSSYGSNQGWTSNNTVPRKLADVDGDGLADVVGFATNGVYVSLGSGITVSHAISLNGVDTWTSNEGGVVRTITIDLATKKGCLELATRIYGVVLDRQMTDRESETLLKYISNGALDAAKLASDLLASGEFGQRFGPLSNAEFLDRIYQNAFEHSATLSDTHRLLSGLVDGALTRVGAALSLANSAENLTNGDERLAEEKFPGNEAFSLQHETDRALALNLVSKLYGTMLDRDPTVAEASAQAQAIVNGSKTVAQVIATLLSSSEFSTKNGANLSSASFIAAMFLNALGRAPTVQETNHWVSALDGGQISRADLILAIAQTPGDSTGNIVPGSSSDDVLNGTSGRDQLSGGAGVNHITGGANADTIVDGQGTDTIHYARGDGDDVIYASHLVVPSSSGAPDEVVGADRLQFGNLNRADISLQRVNASGSPTGAWDDLRIRVLATGEIITVHDQFRAGVTDGSGTKEWGLNGVVFADGSQLTRAQIEAAASPEAHAETVASDGSRTVIDWDVNAGQSWASIRHEYNALGALIYERTLFDDGTSTSVSHDLAGTQAWLSRQEWSDSQGRMTKLITNNDDGSRTEKLWDPANTQVWTSQVEQFNTTGLRTTKDIVNDDGSRSNQIWDVANAQTWATYTTFVNADGLRTCQSGTNDDGSKWTSYWDVANANNWTTYTDYFNAGGHRTSQNGTYDDGRKWVIFWDVAGAYNWSTYTDTMNAAGQRTNQSGTYDDGRKWSMYWDVTGSNNWSTYTDYFDAAGRWTSQSGTYDNGTQWTNYYDPAGAYNWSSYTDYINASGQRTSQSGTYDDGRKWVMFWDPTGAYNWSTYTDYYDASGNRTSQQGTYDSGGSWSYFWDYTSANTLYQRLIIYDGAARPTLQQDNLDSGATIEYGWDYGATNWTSYQKNYNGSGTLMDQTFYLDSGGRSYEWWDIYMNSTIYYQYQHYNAYGYLDAMSTQYDNGTWAYYVAPITVDLDGDGIELLDGRTSGVTFDWDGDGKREKTAWASAKDGFLVIDLAADGSAGADGVIDQKKEIAFTNWAQWTSSDLEALRQAFDSNGDGVLDAKDERWGEFRIWQDKNQNGISEAGELRTLDQWGIKSIDLQADSSTPQNFPDGSMISGTAAITWADGRTTLAGDTALSFTPEALETKTLGGAAPGIISGTGNPEELIATQGADAFVFAQRFGHDTVRGFDAGATGDLIVFNKETFANADDVFGAAQQIGEDVVITKDDENTVTLKNVLLSSLSKDDFRFMA